MKAKVLKMAVLVIALLVVGHLKANSDNAPWAALAEENISSVGDLKIGTEVMWKQSWLDIAGELNSEKMTIRMEEENGLVMRLVQIEDVAVSDYVADEMNFLFHDDRLCMYGYKFDDQCTERRFEYLLDAMNTKYGAAVKKAFSYKGLSNCGLMQEVLELVEVLGDTENESLNWMENALLSFVNLFGSTPDTVYEWKVGSHTKVSMYYEKKNSFLSNDMFFILYSSMQPHGLDWTFKSGTREFNVSGL